MNTRPANLERPEGPHPSETVDAVTASLKATRERDDVTTDEAQRDIESITRTLEALAGTTRLSDAVRVALDTVRTVFGWAYGSYWTVDPSEHSLRFSVESGDAGPEFRDVTLSASFREGVGLSGRAWKSRDLVFTRDLAEITDCVRAPVAQRHGVKSGVCFPIIVHGEVRGTMDFFAMTTLDPAPTRLAALRAVGRLVSQTIERLSLLDTTTSAASALAAASEEMTATAADMASNAARTSAKATDVASAAAHVNDGVQVVASATTEMGASIDEISRNVSDAARVANEAVATVEQTTSTIERLSASSSEIGTVIKLVTEIAQQTNLLALNATIEAARAGDAGKGFAVVANEVKALARQTAEATDDIERKVSAIQAEASTAVTAISEIEQVITRVEEIAVTIAGSVEEQTATTAEINHTIAETALAMAEITSSVTELATAAETTAVGAEQVGAASHQLALLAATLLESSDG